ncbi:MAG: winged helix DNA-binding domain-containing protein [Chloroflexi bacterium]|nr:winged helix DNA-binding domain-containing protein [Chloroflexota bacterium]
MARTDLSADEARRIALHAQGFGRPYPAGRIDARHLRRVINTLGVIQIDSVNVLARAHYMPFFSRLGPYDTGALDRHAWGSGRMFEYWGHEASLIPVERYGLFRHRMDGAFGRTQRLAPVLQRHQALVERLTREIVERGPVAHGDVRDDGEAARTSGWWNWSETKLVLEALYTAGRLAVADRRNFTRLYDLPERVIPSAILEAPAPDETDAQRELLRLAAAHHGIGTAADLADYYRVPVLAARKRLDELADAGTVERVRVEGWTEGAYLSAGARVPRRIEARTVLSPFDPLVWRRERTERLFNFRYRIEIYTPEAQREFGYYVLPFLMDEAIPARVDLKADRQRSQLLVRAAHTEPSRDPAEVAVAVADVLRNVAQWQGLENVAVEQNGALAQPLRSALGG